MEEKKELVNVGLFSFIQIERTLKINDQDCFVRLNVPIGMPYEQAIKASADCTEALKEMQAQSLKRAEEAKQEEEIEPEVLEKKEKNGRKK